MYLCVGADDPSIVTGVYSEYGYVRGTFTSSLTVEGNWYEVGVMYKNGTVTKGTFQWTFDEEYVSFSGYFWEDGVQQIPELGHGWPSDRINNTAPLDSQCWRYTSSGGPFSFTGSWKWQKQTLIISENLDGTASTFNGSVTAAGASVYFEGLCDESD